MISEKKLWSRKAKNFPVYDQTDIEDMKTIHSIIDIAQSRGVAIEGKKIIDIGCGTGRHTLSLAKKAEKVVATDISDEMVKTLIKTSQKYLFTNVETFICDWRQADVQKNGWLKSFDIAWAAMTSAINSAGSIIKMNSCAKEHCVCVAWGRKRENKILERVFSAHGSKLAIPFSALNLSRELDSLKTPHTLDFIDNSWISTAAREDAVKDMCWHLQINGIKADTALIEEIFNDNYGDSPEISHETVMEMGILIWRPINH